MPVLASKSSSAIINTYSTSVAYVTNKAVRSRVRSNGSRYSTSKESEQLLGDKNNSPSSYISPSKNSGRASFSGSIYCRTITKNGKDYSQFFYCWKLQGQKRTRYVPKHLVSQVQQAVEQKRSVIEILNILGVDTSSDKLLGDIPPDPSNSPSKNSDGVISPSKNIPELLGDIQNNPSNDPSKSSDSTISPSKNTPQSLGDIQNNPSNDPSKNLDGTISPSKNIPQLLGDIQSNPSNDPSKNLDGTICPSKNISKLLGDIQNNPSNEPSESSDGTICPSKNRRKKGEGSGSIYWRVITKNRRVYSQAYYHYEVWSEGDRIIKSSKYVPKRLLPQILKLDKQKAPVSYILALLSIMI